MIALPIPHPAAYTLTGRTRRRVRPTSYFLPPPASALRAFTLLEVLLVVAVVAVIMTLIVGIVTNSARLIQDGDAEVRRSQSARAAMDRLAADLRSAVYCGPLGRYGVGLYGEALPHPTAATSGDRITMVVAGLPDRGDDADPTESDVRQRGRADLRIVVYELQTSDAGRVRLVRLQQDVLDAVATGEVTVEVLCEDVRQFHLQYYGRAPSVPLGLAEDGSTLTGEVVLEWSDGRRTGWQSQDGNLSLPEPGTAPADAVTQMPPEVALPAAVHVVLVLGDGRSDEAGNPIEDATPIDDPYRWHETVIALASHSEPTDPKVVFTAAQTSGLLKLLAGQVDSSSSSGTSTSSSTGGTSP